MPSPDLGFREPRHPMTEAAPVVLKEAVFRRLKLHRELIAAKPLEKAKGRLRELNQTGPKTKAAKEARRLLETLSKKN